MCTMSDIDRHGAHSMTKRDLSLVTQRTDYLHLSLDLDVVEPAVAPEVGTPVRGGLDYRESRLIVELGADSRKMSSLEVVEVNPVLDTKNASAEFAVELVQSAFGKRIL